MTDSGSNRAIDTYVKQLRFAFGNGRPPVSKSDLRYLFSKKDYAGMAGLIRSSMGLEVKLRLGIANAGGPSGAIAWTPRLMVFPTFGSSEFRNYTFTIFVRKSFLDKGRFEQVVMVIAHELSHIVLESINHHLRSDERAVDLTAMMLGFRDFYLDGSEYIEERPRTFWLRLKRELSYAFGLLPPSRPVKSILYLQPEEVAYASYLLGGPRREKGFRVQKDAAYLLASLLERLTPILVLSGFLVFAVIVELVAKHLTH